MRRDGEGARHMVKAPVVSWACLDSGVEPTTHTPCVLLTGSGNIGLLPDVILTPPPQMQQFPPPLYKLAICICTYLTFFTFCAHTH